MKPINRERTLYLLAFTLALGIRLLNLGRAPLSDFEAGWALQAFDTARGGFPALGSQPGYLSLTFLSFFLFGSSNFMARIWPALAGSLLVVSPFFVRHRLRRKAALIVAFGLALDPGLVALSRLAGGPMLAVGFGVLSLALLDDRKPAWAGICGGLALLSGPAVLIGLLGLGIAWGVGRLTGISLGWGNPGENEANTNPDRTSSAAIRASLLFGLGTILVVGSQFARNPQGLSAWAATLTDYFGGWASAPGIPFSRMLAALFFYQPLALIFGIVGTVLAWRGGDTFARRLSIWFVSALLVALIYPARQVGDLAWALLPLWGLAGVALSRYLNRQDHWAVPLGEAAVVFVLLALTWVNLSGLNPALENTDMVRWIVIVVSVVLGAFVTLLVALGWSWDAARDGLVMGVVAAVGGYVLANVFGVSQARPNQVAELWFPSPAPQQVELFVDTVSDLALSQTGRADDLDIISLVDAPSLRWILRDLSGLHYQEALGPQDFPSVVITLGDGTLIESASSYRGQDFLWWSSPGWAGGVPANWVGWLTQREAPEQRAHIVLWARSDLFPDDALQMEADQKDQTESAVESGIEVDVQPVDESSP
jgi:hypothetical protein